MAGVGGVIREGKDYSTMAQNEPNDRLDLHMQIKLKDIPSKASNRRDTKGRETGMTELSRGST